jgi:molecular chaperone DnaK
MGRIIGIDLGTTNSVAAYWKGKRARIIENEYASFTPSVVWIENGIERVGRDAKDRLETGSTNIIYSIKRFIGVDYDDPNAHEAITRVGYATRKAPNGEIEVLIDGTYYNATQVSALILKQIKTDAEIKLGEEVTHAVITVPAYFGQRQKNATREAGKHAGLIVPRIIGEPTAAALAFGLEEDIDEPQDVLVYDLGGGTFDVSILTIIDNNFDVLSIDGDRFLGGDDFDNLLVREMLAYIKQAYRVDVGEDPTALMRLKRLAEKAKIDLSRQEEIRIIGDAITQTERGQPLNLSMTMSRSQFDGLIEPLVDKSIAIVQRALEGASITPADLDRVLLVGGSTRVPMVRQKLRALFGDTIEIDVDPMQCVALGAAAQTAFLSDEELQSSDEEEDTAPERTVSPVVIEKASTMPEITMQDMVSKYIGIETKGGNVVPVIPKGTLYPTQEPFRHIFQTNRSGQQSYELPIYESETDTNPKDQWEWIGIVRNDKLPPGLPRSSDIMVEMSIDKDGILYVVSYLKNDPLKDNPEKGTLEQRSFHFGGQEQRKDSSEMDVFARIDFHAFMFEVVVQFPVLKKYLAPDHIKNAPALVHEAHQVLQSKDEQQAQALLPRMEKFRYDLPVPVEAIFWAQWITEDKTVVDPIERSSVQQTMVQMEHAIASDDIDTANQHLNRLRQQTDQLFDKYPSDLLMKRG